MIGVIARPGQAAIVEEFFQLFKTPWEFYRDGKAYDVLISSADDLPAINFRLAVIFGPEDRTNDPQIGPVISSRRDGAVLSYRGERLPLYNEVAVLRSATGEVLSSLDDDSPVGIRLQKGNMTCIRVGYDIFQESLTLFGIGQPTEWALVPTLEIHIQMLRDWILEAGIPLLEIPPIPAGYSFFACLTHDIDFIGIKWHLFDHTMWGFLARATFGSLRRYLKGRISWSRLIENMMAAISLPLVFTGLIKDFWQPFEWYLGAEEDLPSTFFIIPFKGRPGGRLSMKHPGRRAATYDITDIPQWVKTLIERGREIGVHGIDAWNDAASGRGELTRIASYSEDAHLGIRMHWLLWDLRSAKRLEEAGYIYDSSSGYNEAVGYKSGTTQVFRPSGVEVLLELPMNIQDGALFSTNRLDLSEDEGWRRCSAIFTRVGEFGGAVTINWHDRSPHPERFWGDFYIRIIQELKTRGARFGTASSIVGWFRKRRTIAFDMKEPDGESPSINILYHGESFEPPLSIKILDPVTDTTPDRSISGNYRSERFLQWSGEAPLKIEWPHRIRPGLRP